MVFPKVFGIFGYQKVFIFLIIQSEKNCSDVTFLHHHPNSPAEVETEHPKRVNNERKFKIAPGTLDLGSPV